MRVQNAEDSRNQERNGMSLPPDECQVMAAGRESGYELTHDLSRQTLQFCAAAPHFVRTLTAIPLSADLMQRHRMKKNVPAILFQRLSVNLSPLTLKFLFPCRTRKDARISGRFFVSPVQHWIVNHANGRQPDSIAWKSSE
jgi:hypothetical protein